MGPAEAKVENMDTFFAMVGFFLMVVGFVGAVLLMIVGIILQMAYGDISILGQNIFVLIGLSFGIVAFIGMVIFMVQFFLHRKMIEES